MSFSAQLCSGCCISPEQAFPISVCIFTLLVYVNIFIGMSYRSDANEEEETSSKPYEQAVRLNIDKILDVDDNSTLNRRFQVLVITCV